MEFYVGLHHPNHAEHFDRACLSVRAVAGRKKPIPCPRVLLDSGAFTELNLYGEYRTGAEHYAAEIRRLFDLGVLQVEAAVSQDFMCEPFMLAKTGLAIADHQRLTIERYDALVTHDLPVPIMPVLQGFEARDYIGHLEQYGSRLALNQWVGVGSVCKRNGKPEEIAEVLGRIKDRRPDLRLHGFGVKKTALLHSGVRALLATADSMAWSYAARKTGRDQNDWREARRFVQAIDGALAAPFSPWQMRLPLEVV